MKKWLYALLIFTLPVLAATILLFIIPIDKKYAYDFISKGGCQGRPPWIFEQVFKNSINIDIAFTGTSHTMSGVNDSLIENYVFQSSGKRPVCKNISFCGFGRDFDYVVIKDLLQHKRPKVVVLEIREEESQLGHHSFPFVAESKDLFEAPKLFNRSYLPDLYKGFFFRLQYLRELVTGEEEKRQMDVSPSVYGFNGTNATADPIQLDSEFENMLERNKRKNAIIEAALNKYPMTYVAEIARLTKENGTQLVFLYLPAYTHQISEADIMRRYAKFGKVILPDSQTLSDKSNWMDREHLNTKGAEVIARKIAQELSILP